MTFEYISNMQTPEETWHVEAAPTVTLEDEINQFFERQMPLDIREERLGQRMLETPHEGVHWLVAFEDFLYKTKQFSIMLDRDPQRTHRLIARHVRKVPFSALSVLMFNQLLESTVPLLERNEPLCPKPDTRPYYLKHLHYEEKGPFEGNAAAFLHCMYGMLHDGWEDTLTAITDPQHYYYPVWECFEAAQYMLFSARKRSDFPAAEKQCYTIAEDNALVALKLLTHIRMEYAKECAALGSEPSADGATRKTMRSADRIGWAASGNSKSIGKEISIDPLVRDFMAIEASTMHELLENFPNHKRLVIGLTRYPPIYGYNHHSLAEGPWPVGRFCPAVSWLEQPYPPDAETPIKQFDDYLTNFRRRFIPDALKQAPHEPDLTLFMRSTLLLQIAALVGHETIFKEWNTGRHNQVY